MTPKLTDEHAANLARATLDRIAKGSVRVGTFRLGMAYCSHRATRLETSRRAVVCRDCGTVCDAFDVLTRYAREGDVVAELAAQKSALVLSVETLQRDVDRLKSQRRRAEKGAGNV